MMLTAALIATEIAGLDDFASLHYSYDRLADHQPIAEAIKRDKSFSGIKKVLREGMFRDIPSVAEGFLELMDSAAAGEFSEIDLVQRLVDYARSNQVLGFLNLAYDTDEKRRVARRVEQLSKLVTAPDSLIDIGCGNGLITKALAGRWTIDSKSVFGLDIFKRSELVDGYTPVKLDSNGLVPDHVKGDMAMLLMVLHHEANPKPLLKSLFNSLPEGGSLIIREHDVDDHDTKVFLRAFDQFYFSVINGLDGVPQPANYKSAEEWVELCLSIGFKLEKIDYPEPDSPMRPVHLLFRKPECLQMII